MVDPIMNLMSGPHHKCEGTEHYSLYSRVPKNYSLIFVDYEVIVLPYLIINYEVIVFLILLLINAELCFQKQQEVSDINIDPLN